YATQGAAIGGARHTSLASRRRFRAVAVSSTSSRAPLKPRNRSRSSLRMRFMCANLISIFLRSRRDCWNFSIGQSADVGSYVLGVVTRDLPGVRRRTPRLELAPPAVVHACPVRQDTALVDEAVIGEELTRWADVDVALPIEHEIRSAKLAVGPSRFVPYGHVWCDCGNVRWAAHACGPYRCFVGICLQPNDEAF